MNNKLNRRDFLKLLSLLPAVTYLPRVQVTDGDEQKPNILVLVFDAWSAQNISLYGYSRQTTPNLARLAENAIVYHNHYSGGTYTYPATSSLLTGVLPWRHQAYNWQAVKLLEPYRQENIFGWMDTHHRFTYTHNTLADSLLREMLPVLDEYIPQQELFIKKNFLLHKVFGNDLDAAQVAWVRTMQEFENGYANSPFFSRLHSLLVNRSIQQAAYDYPLGMPAISSDQFFSLETAIDWTIAQVNDQPAPFFGYVHYLPPHLPYTPRRDFFDHFRDDGHKLTRKPNHPLNEGYTFTEIIKQTKEYDEFILFVDHEIGRLMDHIQRSPEMNNTWVILTSDHGEQLERGLIGHNIATFHHPLMHVPLLIFPPGQDHRVDVHQSTTAIDLSPTLLHLSGNPIPSGLEGQVLPPFNTTPTADRPIFSADARANRKHGAINNGGTMIKKGNYKLSYLFGQSVEKATGSLEPIIELYDLANDPQELKELGSSQPDVKTRLLEELLDKMKAEGALI